MISPYKVYAHCYHGYKVDTKSAKLQTSAERFSNKLHFVFKKNVIS
jgi:hypothetical protein